MPLELSELSFLNCLDYGVDFFDADFLLADFYARFCLIVPFYEEADSDCAYFASTAPLETFLLLLVGFSNVSLHAPVDYLFKSGLSAP